MMFLRRGFIFALDGKPQYLLSWAYNFCSKITSSQLNKEGEVSTYSVPLASCSSSLYLSPLFPDKPHRGGYDVEILDDDAWRASAGLAQACRGIDTAAGFLKEEVFHETVEMSQLDEEDPDFDEIDNMRINGNLFYKLDCNSKEYEEYNIDFHRRDKASKKKDNKKETKTMENDSKGSRAKDNHIKLNRKKDKVCANSISIGEKCGLVSLLDENGMNKNCIEKKQRTLTFNQLTAPYHEPFCLDIYISKASVRACIIHRVTSKVVAVAHSISKDMKFDLGSTRNSTACTAVGAVLAQRILADDIHDVSYTPRKGEKLEGKLQLVLQSIIDNGINVKVKIKQRKTKNLGAPSYQTKYLYKYNQHND